MREKLSEVKVEIWKSKEMGNTSTILLVAVYWKPKLNSSKTKPKMKKEQSTINST